MKNSKKTMIATGLAATVLFAGGTAAYFTSTDSLKNPFSSGETTGNNSENGGTIQEDFRSDATTNPDRGAEDYDNKPGSEYGDQVIEGPKQVVPGEQFIKKVRVFGDADYKQFVRATVQLKWSDTFLESLVIAGKGVDKAAAAAYANTFVAITFPSTSLWNGSKTLVNDATGGTTEWLYYNEILAPGAATGDIIEAVKLLPTAGNEFKNADFEVIIATETIQATQEAWSTAIINGGWAQVGPAPTEVVVGP
ncbi:MAG: SipW-dependent-type signal peptide-containing protein [Culicoidibacterales bacterium]